MRLEDELKKIELLPCPFCGLAVKMESTEDGFGYDKSWVGEIRCCVTMQAGFFGEWGDDKNLKEAMKTAKKWNTRC